MPKYHFATLSVQFLTRAPVIDGPSCGTDFFTSSPTGWAGYLGVPQLHAPSSGLPRTDVTFDMTHQEFLTELLDYHRDAGWQLTARAAVASEAACLAIRENRLTFLRISVVTQQLEIYRPRLLRCGRLDPLGDGSNRWQLAQVRWAISTPQV